jgi:hypothetical protein
MVLAGVLVHQTFKEKFMSTYYDDDLADVQIRASKLSDETKWLPELYNRASAYDPDLFKDREKDTLHTTGRVLAWLGLAEPNEDAECGYEASSYLVQRIAQRGLKEKRLKSAKIAASFSDMDVIESIFEGALGEEKCAQELRAFVFNVLSVLGLVKFATGGEAVPTRFLRKLVGTCRQEDRFARNRRGKEDDKPEGVGVEQWLAIRKEVGLHIDAEIAEVFWKYTQVLDPYGVEPDLPPECYQTGRDHFARSPRSDVWVWFGDLPEATCGALEERITRRSKFNRNGRRTREA